MSAAIFYLAAGKRSVLRQLAKTSRDDRRALDKLMMQVQALTTPHPLWQRKHQERFRALASA